MSLHSDLLGRTWLMFQSDSVNTTHDAQPPNNSSSKDILPIGDHRGHYLQRQLIVVIRVPRTMDTVVQIFFYIFICASTIGMGCKTDLVVVKEVLKKPVAPSIGFFCQYVLMPLIAFGVAKLVSFDNPAVQFGIFACGVCPGGGLSNIYSFLLGGDVSLSVTMTTISTIAALGMVPLWIFTLGQHFSDDKIAIKVPYTNIVQTLATIILPLIAGLIIKYKWEKIAKLIVKVIKPVTIVTIIVLLSIGIWSHLYIFRLFKPSSILAGCLLPYCGYVIGGVIALIFRQPWYRVKTIAIETGIQNVMVAYLILVFGLPPPDGDLAAVGPAASAVMTPLPLFVLAIIYNIYLRCKKSYAKVPDRDEPETKDKGTKKYKPKKANKTGQKMNGTADAQGNTTADKEVVDRTTCI